MSQADLNTLVNDVNGAIAMLENNVTVFQQVKDGLNAAAVQTKALCDASKAACQAQLDSWNSLKASMSDAVNVDAA